MMSGVVERLGVDMKYTTEDEAEIKKREESEQKRYGDTYRMNPKFYEITKNQFQHWHDIYMTPYSGCKVIIPVRGMRLEAVLAKPAKVIMMWRDPAEIRQSQEASYKKARASYTGPDDMEPWEHAEASLRTHLASTEVMLDKRVKASNDARSGTLPDCKTCSWAGSNGGAICVTEDPTHCERYPRDIQPFDFMVVKYRDVLENPKKKVAEVARFIQADMSLVDYAISSIDPDKIRFKKEELAEGI